MSKRPAKRSEAKEWTPPAKAVVTVKTESPKTMVRPRVAEVTVEEIPPQCPRCQSTDRDKKNGTICRNICGMSRDGRPFNRVKWTYCQCRKCGQGYRVISRINTED